MLFKAFSGKLPHLKSGILRANFFARAAPLLHKS
jgi:hypothetical protein